MIRLGYACINTKLPAPNRTCRLRNAAPGKILELAAANLTALEDILQWNAAHEIELFRITSDLIPFGSHPVNTLPWRRIFSREFARIGAFVRRHRLRVSMHPGQFTVLNSPRADVVRSSIKELAYHTAVLDALSLDNTHKVVIHLGGIYADKAASLRRFIETCRNLDRRILSRLVIENDERCYNIADAIRASKAIGVPVVFDVFHHSWNAALEEHSLRSIIEMAGKTWRKRDGRMKIHYSNQWPGAPAGTHSKTINVRKFIEFYESVQDLDLDIMLEVKDKQESVLNLRRFLNRRQLRAA